MNLHGRDIKIFSCNSHPRLAQEIAEYLGLKVGNSEVKTFSDGETSVSLYESVRGSDVFVIQSTCHPVNDNLMELLIMIDALKRASAGRITAVIPYYGYARQDRKAKGRDPITAKLVADLITAAGADRILTMDLHAPQIQGFFNIPVDHLVGSPLLASFLIKKFEEEGSLSNRIVMSPDIGSIKRAREFASRLDLPIAIIDKRRSNPNESQVMNIIGDVRDKHVIILDDMVDTGGTLFHAAEAIKNAGALSVTAAATHAVLSGSAMDYVRSGIIEELLFLDTIPLPPEKHDPRITVLPISATFADAIARIYSDKPMSTLFDEQNLPHLLKSI